MWLTHGDQSDDRFVCVPLEDVSTAVKLAYYGAKLLKQLREFPFP